MPVVPKRNRPRSGDPGAHLSSRGRSSVTTIPNSFSRKLGEPRGSLSSRAVTRVIR